MPVTFSCFVCPLRSVSFLVLVFVAAASVWVVPIVGTVVGAATINDNRITANNDLIFFMYNSFLSIAGISEITYLNFHLLLQKIYAVYGFPVLFWILELLCLINYSKIWPGKQYFIEYLFCNICGIQLQA